MRESICFNSFVSFVNTLRKFLYGWAGSKSVLTEEFPERRSLWRDSGKPKQAERKKICAKSTRTQLTTGEIPSMNLSFDEGYPLVLVERENSLAKNLLAISQLERSFSFSVFLAKELKVSQVAAETKVWNEEKLAKFRKSVAKVSLIWCLSELSEPKVPRTFSGLWKASRNISETQDLEIQFLGEFSTKRKARGNFVPRSQVFSNAWKLCYAVIRILHCDASLKDLVVA